jgi:hypothetical protein
MIKKYAFISDGYVFHVVGFDDEHPTAAKWINALNLGVSFINVKEYFNIRPEYFYDGKNFYLPEDTEKINPIEKEINQDPKIEKYAAINNGKVIGLLTTEQDDSNTHLHEMIVAGMASSPIVIDCTGHEFYNEIIPGWTYSDLKFNRPN